MRYFGIIIAIIIILLAMTAFRDGIEEIRSNPVKSTLESSKIVYDNGKKIVETFQEIQENNTNG